jgi:hypothetical protein
MGFSEKECIGCERCGAFIPKTLVQFHKCRGTDFTKRPANVPLDTWLSIQAARQPTVQQRVRVKVETTDLFGQMMENARKNMDATFTSLDQDFERVRQDYEKVRNDFSRQKTVVTPRAVAPSENKGLLWVVVILGAGAATAAFGLLGYLILWATKR